jgi:flagellar basal-body rod protein FlgB
MKITQTLQQSWFLSVRRFGGVTKSMGALDTGLNYYSTVLELRGIRQQLLSADIANASTPGFKAVDLDFREALAASLMGEQAFVSGQSPMVMLVSDSAQIMSTDEDWPNAAAKRAVKYQTGAPVSLDGNSVDLNFEKLQASQNALDYEAAVNFTTQIISMLMTAIKGSTSSSQSG